ncbi:F-box protein CPR1-like [Papaver somniferum]|uniref:F-box protein CPR1-like n=1 Tax=Papaver somniferum TaxID=3469 RepID=UPI000E701EA4|nr:F-box protein CPR1-like [Papaver somniferum]
MSSVLIPKEILNEILLRLPPNSVTTCRCICKQWNALLSNPSFLKSHLAVENQNPSFILVTRNYDEDIDEEDFSIIHVPQASLSSLETDLERKCESDSVCECERHCDKGSFVDYPFHREVESSDEVSIMGVCNGILCLLIGQRVEEETQSIICFWNPGAKEYKRLTNPPSEFSSVVKIVEDYSAYGFYYNSTTEDYKLIKIVVISGESRRLGFQIYSLRSNSWENSQKFIPYRSLSRHRNVGILVHGGLHWLLNKPGNATRNVIVSFSTCDEGFGNLALPEAVQKKNVTKELGKLDGSLCLLVESESRIDGADLWVMQKYGVKQSWNKLFTTTEENIFMSNGMPVCVGENEFYCFVFIVLVGIELRTFRFLGALTHFPMSE